MIRSPEVALIVVALVLRLLVAQAMPLVEVDGAYWCSLAGNLARGDFAHGLSTAWPPLYPAGVALMARSLALLGATPGPENLEWSARLVSALAGTLLLVPLASIALRLLPRPAALVTLLIAAVHPRLVEYSAAALSESLFSLMLVGGLAAYLISEPRVAGGGQDTAGGAGPGLKRAWRLEALAGALFGGAFLARPEGLPLGFALWSAGLARSGRPWRSRLRPGFVAALAVVCLPWLLFLHARTGEWTLGEKGAYNLWKANRAAYARHYPEPRVLPQRVNRSPEIAPPAAPGELRMAGLMRREPGTVFAGALRNLTRVVFDSLPVAVGWPVALIAIAGLFAPRAGPWWPVLVILATSPLMVAPFSADRRFLVPLVPLALLLVGATYSRLARRRPERLAAVLAGLLAAGLLAYATGIPSRADRAPEQRAAGEWMREASAHGTPGRGRLVVMAHKPQVAFYAGGLIADLPDAPPDSILADALRTRVDVLVVDARAARGDRQALAAWLDPAHGPPGWRVLKSWSGPDALVLYAPERDYSAGSIR